MKIQIYSDLHTELQAVTIPGDVLAQSDLVVLAGDIGIAEKCIKWIKDNIPDKPVIWVWGNHELYGGHWERTRVKCQRNLEGTNITILENSSVIIGGIRFVGTSLWTDCKINEDSVRTFAVLQEMAQRMNDYRKIRAGNDYRRLRPGETIGAHLKAVEWMESVLNEPFNGSTVVITHHGPHRRCLNDRTNDIYLDGAYASDLSALIYKYSPELWIYGHTHKAADFYIGETRLVSNPLGYAEYGENTGFDMGFSIEI